MELLLARGGGRGLFEETFLFGTTSDEDETDGGNPGIDFVVDIELCNGPLFFKPRMPLKLIKTYKFEALIKQYMGLTILYIRTTL